MVKFMFMSINNINNILVTPDTKHENRRKNQTNFRCTAS